jgi:hypothetical protein
MQQVSLVLRQNETAAEPTANTSGFARSYRIAETHAEVDICDKCSATIWIMFQASQGGLHVIAHSL